MRSGGAINPHSEILRTRTLLVKIDCIIVISLPTFLGVTKPHIHSLRIILLVSAPPSAAIFLRAHLIHDVIYA